MGASLLPWTPGCGTEKKTEELASDKSNDDKMGKTSALFSISLAQWSLHRSLDGGMKNIDFPAIARNTYEIDAVEYVNSFFFDKAKDPEYLSELKNRCNAEGVQSVLIMCDRLGNLGNPDQAERLLVVENHYPWVEAAKYLGCHSIRVNARSTGEFEEQQKLAADGLRKLCEFSNDLEINVLVENHGGLSSNGQWLAVMAALLDREGTAYAVAEAISILIKVPPLTQ